MSRKGGNVPSSIPYGEKEKFKCCKCGKQSTNQGILCYQSKSPLFKASGYFSICKDCMNDLFYEYKKITNDGCEAMRRVCMKFDIYFNKGIYYSTQTNEASNQRLVGTYLKNLNLPSVTKSEWGKASDKTYDDTILEERTVLSNLAVTIDDTNNSDNLPSTPVEWTEIEIENKDTAIDAIGYDPFEGYENTDRKFLFNDLIRYFDDEISDDTYKLSQVIQIVNNNNQIRKIDLIVTRLSEDGIHINSKDVKELIELKKKLVESNDKIAKENEISVKNRSNKEAGKSTLGYLQRDLRKKGFLRAEEDYYDQLQSSGTYWAVGMSNKAVLENSLFDENDKKQVFEKQRELINNLQNQLDHALEKSRSLQVKIDALDNGDSNA